MKCYSKPTPIQDAQAKRQAARDEWIQRRQGKAVIDAAYHDYMKRKEQASQDDAQRLSGDAASSHRRNLDTSDVDAQAQRDKARQEFMARRHGKFGGEG